nr:variant-silencing SET domain-containing protein-like [Ipomoea batatas]
MSSGGGKKGPPKHQNRFAWKPNAGKKINETEPGGRFRPLSEITGVCLRCKEQIDWKRKYGKYKPLAEPAKCQKCSKRNVRQAYHNICTACAKEHNVCAKCSCRVDRIIGRFQFSPCFILKTVVLWIVNLSTINVLNLCTIAYLCKKSSYCGCIFIAL